MRIGGKKILIKRIIHHFRVGATELTSNKEADPVHHPTNSKLRILKTNEESILIPLEKLFFNPTTRGINPSQVEVRRFKFTDRF